MEVREYGSTGVREYGSTQRGNFLKEVSPLTPFKNFQKG